MLDVYAVLTPVSLLTKLFGLGTVLCATIAVLGLLFGLGAAVCPREVPGSSERLGLGFMLLGVCVALVGALGLLNLKVLLPLLGGLALWGYRRQRQAVRREAMQWGCLGGIAAFLLLSKILNALLPQAHGDALYYHLPSAWLWAKAEKIYFIEWLPWSLQGGVGEYLYAFLSLLLPERMAVQIGGQLLHVAFGYGITTAVIYRIGRRWLPNTWTWIACIAFLTFSAQNGQLLSAKNDGYVMALAMLSLLQVSECFHAQDKRREVLAYVFGFGAFAVKNTAVFYLLPFIALFWLFQAQLTQAGLVSTALRHVKIALFTSPLALPAMLRNFAFTGNPMFPAMDDAFKSTYMNQWLRDYMRGFSYWPASPIEMLQTQFQRLWGSKLFYLLGFLAIPIKTPMVRFLTLLSGLAFILLLIVTGAGQYPRFHYYLYAVLSLLAATGAYQLWQKIPTRGDQQKPTLARYAVGTVFAALILVSSGVEVSFQQVARRFVPWLISSESYLVLLGHGKPMLAMQQWMNAHLENARIFSFTDNESYYLNFPLTVPENHMGANEIWRASTFAEAIEKLKRDGYTHLLIPPHHEKYFVVLTEAPEFAQRFTLQHEEHGYRLFHMQRSQP